MIMNNRRVFYDESIWEKFENQVKTWTYNLMHELLQNQVCSAFLYKFLVIIEGIQILYYIVHPQLNFYWPTVWYTYLQDILQYFQVNYITDNGGLSVLLIVAYIAFSVQILMLLLLIIITFKLSTKKKSSTFLTYILKIYSLYGLLINTIFAVPFFNAFIVVIYCNQNASFSSGLSCYQGLHFLHLSLAIVGLILFMINLVLFGLLYCELNPSSQIPFASPQSKTPLFKQLLKLILPLYVTLDYNGNIGEVFISLLACYLAIMMIQRYRTAPYYNKSVYNFIVVQEVILFWASLVGVFTAFLDLNVKDDMGLFYLIIGMPITPFVYFQLLSFRQWLLLKTPIKSFKKETDIETYVNHLIDLIENREQPYQRIVLEGVLKIHIKNCQKNSNQDACPCLQISQDQLKDEESPQKLKRWYCWIKSIISDALDRYPKCPRLHLLNSYVHHEKLKNKFKALFELMITEENKPNMQEEFSIYRYKNLIEEEMQENDQRAQENKGIDVNMMVIFQNKFVTFLGSIEKSVTLHMEFWRELLEENPDIQKLQSLGSKITNTVESTNDFFKVLNDMNPNHIKCLQIYGKFLKEIVNDDVEGQRILEKSDYISKSTAQNKLGLDQDRLKYGENSNTCIITCSGNYNNIGIVTNTNNEITRILGFSKSDVIGQNVNRIMPKVYADQHDQFMKSYLETSDSKVIGQERMLLAQNKNSYLVPCTLMIKVLPNLDEGIQIVGFLKDIEQGSQYMRQEQDVDAEVHYIIVNANNWAILGITQSCYTKFGIPSSLVYGNSTNSNEFTLDNIAPELADSKNNEDLQNGGLVTYIDTTQIQQNFLLGRGDSDDELSMEDEENIYEPLQHVQQTHSQMQSKIGDSNLGQMISNNQYKETQMDTSQQQISSKQQSIDEKVKKRLLKTQRYKKYKIKAYIQDTSDFGDLRIQIIKFHEADDNEDMKPQRSVEPMADEQNIAKTTVKEELQPIAEKDDNNNSDGSSVSGASVNDDMRQLKDFKAMISEKTEPKSIRILKRTVWFIMIILIILSALILGYKINQNNDMQEGSNAIYTGYLRHNVMADVNFYTRLLSMLGNFTYTPTSRRSTVAAVQTQVQTNLSNLVNNLQNIQFDVIKARITEEARQSDNLDLQTYPIAFLLTSGAIQIYQNIFNDALFQFITSASSLRNATLTSFNGSIFTNINNDDKNFYYVMTNGLFVLRNGSEFYAQNFFNFYQDLINGYKSTFYAIMSVGIVCLVISCCVLIPIVFQVHKTNNRVMSLFGIIPIPEIKNLANKCEKYMQDFLEDKNEKKEVVDAETDKPPQQNPVEEQKQEVYEVDNEDEDVQQAQPKFVISQIKSGTQQPQQNGTNSVKSDSQKNKLASNLQANLATNVNNTNLQPGQPNSNNIHSSIQQTSNAPKSGLGPTAVTQGLTKNEQKNQQNIQDDKKENEEEAENLRSQKLLNSKDNNKSVVIVQFMIFALIFIAYFILDINLEIAYLSNVSMIYNHLSYTSHRPIVIKYNVYFTFDMIVQKQIREQIFKTNYIIMRGISFSLLTNSFPSQFNTYMNYFNAFTYNNLCANQFSQASDNFVMNQANCNAVDSGLLQSGLKTAFVSVALSTNDMISYWNSTNQTTRALIDTINNQPYFDKLQYLTKFHYTSM
ncbi:hypothetical protein pb186bvf_017604 [Paramecium bursaria]